MDCSLFICRIPSNISSMIHAFDQHICPTEVLAEGCGIEPQAISNSNRFPSGVDPRSSNLLFITNGVAIDHSGNSL